MKTKQTTIFDGIMLERADHIRLGKQAREIFALMSDKRWRTLRQINLVTGHPTTSISAQLRNFRKEKFGSHTVMRRKVRGHEGLSEYKLIINPKKEGNHGKEN